jgi:hypothetical protein
LAIRPVFHQEPRRIEAHIFIAFLAYCMQVTLQRRLHALAPGLTARSALEKFVAVQMIYVHLPTSDGRELRLTRYSQPDFRSSNSSSNCRRSRHLESPPSRSPSHPECSEDLCVQPVEKQRSGLSKTLQSAKTG